MGVDLDPLAGADQQRPRRRRLEQGGIGPRRAEDRLGQPETARGKDRDRRGDDEPQQGQRADRQADCAHRAHGCRATPLNAMP